MARRGQWQAEARRGGRVAHALVLSALALGAVSSVLAEHSPVLPAPRELHYGEGSLPLDGVRVDAGRNPDADDLFSAATLSGCLATALAGRGHLAAADAPNSGTRILLERTGASDPLATPGDTVGPDGREAYTLAITRTGATLQAKSSAGIFYGVQTLCQMIETRPVPALPVATVHDWPAMAFRGTMVDMSEGQRLRVEEIKQQIDLMARLKMNQYYFYNETTIALDGLPPAAPGARISKDEVREIVVYGRQRHVDVIPCLELYGHLHDLFRREEYSDLADFPHGVELDPAKPRAQQLIANWAEQYMNLFPSAFVHVGFDETWQLRQAAANGSASPADYFVEQLNHVGGFFRQHGKTVMAWADIMVKYPQIIPRLPAGIVAVPWFYDPRPDPTYARWISPIAAAHVPFLVAPGVNGWSEIAPDFNLTFDNIDTLLAAGRRAGALGMMNTIWSDDLQMLKQPALSGIAYGAVASWQSGPVDRTRFFAEYAALASPQAAVASFASALNKMAASETALQRVLGQDTMLVLWHSPFAERLLAKAAAHSADLRESRLLAEGAEDDLVHAQQEGMEPRALDSYLVECRLLDYAGLKFQYGVEIEAAWQALGSRPSPEQLENDFDNLVVSQQHGKLADLMEAITELKPQYEQAWLEQYTSFRLAATLGRWDAEYEYWRVLQANLQNMLDSYDPARGLPLLNTLLPVQ
jgi:hypothetical protein